MTKKFFVKKQQKKKNNLWICIILGLIIGFINGFFGGGGGMIVVPLLCFVLGFADKKAHASAILIILPLCLISAGIYIYRGAYSWEPTLWTGIGTIVGGILGALMLKNLSNKVIRALFSLIMIGAGLKMIF